MKKVYQAGLGLQIHNIVKKLPTDVQIDAKALLLFIRDKKLMKWNDNGEVIFKSKRFKNSNIKNLILHAVTNVKEKPKGYKYFYSILRKEKIPNYLLQNNLRKYTKRSESVMWRPPGELNK